MRPPDTCLRFQDTMRLSSTSVPIPVKQNGAQKCLKCWHFLTKIVIFDLLLLFFSSSRMKLVLSSFMSFLVFMQIAVSKMNNLCRYDTICARYGISTGLRGAPRALTIVQHDMEERACPVGLSRFRFRHRKTGHDWLGTARIACADSPVHNMHPMAGGTI